MAATAQAPSSGGTQPPRPPTTAIARCVCFVGNRTWFSLSPFIQETRDAVRVDGESYVSCFQRERVALLCCIGLFQQWTQTPSVRRENSFSGIGWHTTVIFLSPKKSSLGSGGPFCTVRLCPVEPQRGLEPIGTRITVDYWPGVRKINRGKLWPPTIASFFVLRNRVVVRSFRLFCQRAGSLAIS